MPLVIMASSLQLQRSICCQVHARDKRVDPNLNWNEVARAMSGFTGADCMGLMLRAQGMAARQVSKYEQSVGSDRLQVPYMRRDGCEGGRYVTWRGVCVSR